MVSPDIATKKVTTLMTRSQPFQVTDFVSVFQIVRERYGALEYVDLVPDGGNTPVNAENRWD